MLQRDARKQAWQIRQRMFNLTGRQSIQANVRNDRRCRNPFSARHHLAKLGDGGVTVRLGKQSDRSALGFQTMARATLLGL